MDFECGELVENRYFEEKKSPEIDSEKSLSNLESLRTTVFQR